MSARSHDLLDHGSGALLGATARAVVDLYRPLLGPLSLTHPQYLVLLALDRPDPQTCSELGTRLHLTRATITPLLQRMDALDLVLRRRDPRDERRQEVTLSAGGRRLLPELTAIGEHVQRTLAASGSSAGRLHRLLGEIVDAAV
jgi:DNA-binding MarR family transcriptional regulator